jgi:hypothetical protein
MAVTGLIHICEYTLANLILHVSVHCISGTISCQTFRGKADGASVQVVEKQQFVRFSGLPS